MTTDITHTAFFGTEKHVFTLTDQMILELERVTDCGIGALYQRTIAMQFRSTDLTEIIRLGLIGGGMNPETAMQLCTTYASNRPLSETFPLALDILDKRWGSTDESEAA